MSGIVVPRVFISWAHRHSSWSDEQADRWETTLYAFAYAIEDQGIEAEIDLWHQHAPPDWSRWGQERVRSAEFILVALDRGWRERWEGSNAPTEGAGVVGEADALKGLFHRDQADFRRRTILVILPGADDPIVPIDLHGITRYRVAEFDTDGLDELMRHLTAQPRYQRPTRGPVPTLPPRPAPSRPASESPSGADDRRGEPPAGDRPNPGFSKSGRGDDVVLLPSLSSADLLLRAESSGSSGLLVVKGGADRALLHGRNPYSGCVLLAKGSVPSEIEIHTQGAWSIKLDVAADLVPDLVGSLAGRGDGVVRWPGGAAVVRIVDTGSQGVFVLGSIDADRSRPLAHGRSPYEGTVRLPQDAAWLTIRSTGDWNLQVDRAT